MPQFKLYFLDNRRHIVTARDFEGDGDAAAIAAAEKVSGTHAIEVWCGARLVKLVGKHNVSLEDGSETA